MPSDIKRLSLQSLKALAVTVGALASVGAVLPIIISVAPPDPWMPRVLVIGLLALLAGFALVGLATPAADRRRAVGVLAIIDLAFAAFLGLVLNSREVGNLDGLELAALGGAWVGSSRYSPTARCAAPVSPR